MDWGRNFLLLAHFRVLSLLPIHSGTHSWPCWAACTPLCLLRSFAILLETIWLHGGWGLWRTAALVPLDCSCKRHCTSDLRIGPLRKYIFCGGSSHTFSKRIAPAEAPHHPLLPCWQPSVAPPLLFLCCPLASSSTIIRGATAKAERKMDRFGFPKIIHNFGWANPSYWCLPSGNLLHSYWKWP